MLAYFDVHSSMTLYNIIQIIKGRSALEKGNIEKIQKDVSEIQRNMSIVQSIVSRLTDIEKHVRALESYATEGQEAENG